MPTLIFLAIVAVVAFLVAWVVNGLVGLLSGERPQDTGRQWLDIFLRMFAVLELGVIGRILNYVGLDGLPRKIVLFSGLLCLLLFLVGDCHHEQTGQVYSYHGYILHNTNGPNTALEPTPTAP